MVVVVPLNYWKGSGTIEILVSWCYKVWVFKFQGPRMFGRERERILLGRKPFSLSTRRFNPF